MLLLFDKYLYCLVSPEIADTTSSLQFHLQLLRCDDADMLNHFYAPNNAIVYKPVLRVVTPQDNPLVRILFKD